MSARVEEVLAYPLRECTSWCSHREKGDRHAAEHPDDRSCWTDYSVVALSQHQPIWMGDKTWWRAFLNVYLRRRPEDVAPVVYIHSEETDHELILTLPEVAELISTLQALLATGEETP